MSTEKVLIDSHVLIWLLHEPEKISSQAKDLLVNAKTVYMSTVSLWELTLKFSKGKLAYQPAELADGVHALNLELLSLGEAHVLATLDIQLTHKDPFDGLLVAQSLVEGCVFLTADSHILNSTYTTCRANS